MAKPKGSPKTGGRQKGSQNKITASVKEAFAVAFAQLQGEDGVNLVDWGRGNTTEFYKLASKLIPTEIQAQVESHSIVWQEEKTYEAKPKANGGT